MTPRNVFTGREDQPPRWFWLAHLGGRIAPNTTCVVPRGAKNPVRGRMVSSNIRRATLWGEVVNHKQSILCVKRKSLKSIGRGGPRTRQVLRFTQRMLCL